MRLTYTQPLLCVLLATALAGIVHAWRRSAGRKPHLAAAAFTALFLACWPPADWLFALVLETPYATTLAPGESAYAIVVPASNVESASPPMPAIPDARTYARCRYAAWLYHTWHRIPVIVSGGRAADGSSLAVTMARVLQAEGVPPWSIVLESRASDTHENAERTARSFVTPASTTCTVALSAPAPSGGLGVSLSATSPAVTVSPSITIPAGQATGGFTASASAVTPSTTATITASDGPATAKYTIILVPPPSLLSLTCSPGVVRTGGSVACSVKLTSAATAPVVVSLSSDNAAILLPSAVVVPSRGVSAAFSAVIGGVAGAQTGTVTATAGSVTKTATVSVAPATSVAALIHATGSSLAR